MPLLKEIASVQIGYHFRGRIKPVMDGRYKLIQIKDVSKGGTDSFENLMPVNISDLKHEQLLRKGDVLLVGRGDRRRAMAITSDLKSATVGSQFFIIRANQSVDPGYLAWVLNRDPAQRYLAEKSVGTNVKIISKEAVSHLSISLPDLETQRRIATLHALNEKQKQLMETIAEKRYRVTEQSLLNLIQSSEKGQEVK
jgi:restriction endonuclease S subunit